ncbi:MAG: cytidine deaminase [Alphaproteobacteria bacterium]|nr:cytidine deaminase [Alphaproteobacteria bacterium]MDP6815857.1 cytidine deaminase [Alphaproteobacteria bacterium]
MLKAAREVRERAHAPYSGYRVGAAVLGAGGGIHAGCNVENSAYPEGLCAEAAAIAAMVAAGEGRIQAVLVVGDGADLITPCGGCRQKIREFAGPDTPVHLCTPAAVVQTVTLDELLPLSFGPEHLE